MIANQETSTRVDEVAAGIYRISTPLDVIPGGFTFNSYLLAAEEPLLFHAGYRKLFPVTLDAVKKVLPAEKLRWIGGSHFGFRASTATPIAAMAPHSSANSPPGSNRRPPVNILLNTPHPADDC